MASKTSICNKALRRLGENPIIDINTDTSRPAALCKSSYDEILEEVLREHNWNFAIVRQELVQDASNEPLYEFAYAYVLPTTPKFISLVDIENNPDFKLEGNRILTDVTSLNIRYVSRVDDPNKYDSLFINAFSLRLAYEIALSLTGDSRSGGLTRVLQEEYILALSKARDLDFQEENKTPLFESEFINSRFINPLLGTNTTNITVNNA
jgi:hypothetical protein